MALDQSQEAIVSALRKNPQGLSVNRLFGEYQKDGGTRAKQTFLDRLNQLEKAGAVAYTEGPRNSKIYQLNDEVLAQNRAKWAFNILRLRDAIYALSEEAASRHSNRLKLLRGTFIVQNEVSRYILRFMILERTEGLRMNLDREEKLSGVMVESLFIAYAAFQRKIGATHEEVDSAISEVEESIWASGVFGTLLRLDRPRKDVDEWMRQLPKLWKRARAKVDFAVRSMESLKEEGRKRSDEYQELLRKPVTEPEDIFKREIDKSLR